MCTPYNDLVWEEEWVKILSKARNDIRTHIIALSLQMMARLQKDFGINPQI